MISPAALVWLIAVLLVLLELAVSPAVASPPEFSTENHSATDGAGFEFNSSWLPLTVSGEGTLLLAAWHSEYDGDTFRGWIVEYAGVPGTLLVVTNGYWGGDGNGLFRIYYWLNPPPGPNTLVVSNDYNGPNELSVSAVLFTNVAQIPIDSPGIDVSTNLRTGEMETVATSTNDLVVHVIANRLFTRGTLGEGEVSRSIANDAVHVIEGDASLWISTKPGESPSTTVSSSNWASSVVNGVAIVLHGTGSASPPTISDIPDQSIPMNTPTAPIPFTVGDPGGAVESLLLIADSSNPALVPTNNIVFGGSGTDRTMIVTPETEQTGTAFVTVTVSNGGTTASDLFMLTVNPVTETVLIAPSSADSYRVQVRGIPRTTYDIQFTGRLSPTDWQLLATATTDAQGAGETLDPLIPGTEARFYRAVRGKP